MIGLALLAAMAMVPSTPELGKAEGQCRPGESGPAFLVEVHGLKDRRGWLKLELYPANDADFLEDDNILLSAGKVFRRVVMAIPSAGPVTMCIRAPRVGTYALSLLHDRDSNRKFSVLNDGVGFPGDPHLGWSKPKASVATAHVGDGPTPVVITLQYHRGLFSFGPLRR